ncbi:MAG: ribosome biogenesis GTPase YlqF, partial [Clostridia bacterium]|nr:ribosome biogenesis GTPase YlqF [Clostridia bacterium]
MEKKKVTGTKKPGNKESKRSDNKTSKFDRKASPAVSAKKDGQAPGKKDAPFRKNPRLITDSATGEQLDVSKRPKRPKKQDSERRAATGSELAKAIQWFPGHMTKAIREINESLSMVDIAIELCDARIPVSSRNPNIEKILNGKPYITLMNKSSLADPNCIAEWKKYFADQGKTVIFTDCHTGTGICEIVPAIREALKEKLAAYESKGMRRLPKAMILGVTNSGKSTLINKLYGSKKTKAENRAGVTRVQQWVTVEGLVELLDTPGILWPKFDDEAVGLHLAFTGAIKDEILDIEEIAVILCRELIEKYPNLMMMRYKLKPEDIDDRQSFEIFETIGRNRGLL